SGRISADFINFFRIKVDKVAFLILYDDFMNVDRFPLPACFADGKGGDLPRLRFGKRHQCRLQCFINNPQAQGGGQYKKYKGDEENVFKRQRTSHAPFDSWSQQKKSPLTSILCCKRGK